MLRTSRLRLLADYLGAASNEIAVDEMFLRMAHLTPAHVGYLPRVPRWLSKAMRAPALSRIVWRFAWLVWLSGGALLYFGLELLKFERLRCRPGEMSTTTVTLTEGAVIGFSSRTCDVVDPNTFPALPSAWLTFPWVSQYNLPEGAYELPLMTLVGRTELRQAFTAAIRATYALACDPSRSRWALQSYTAFRWFLVRSAVDRISGTLVMTDHFDRWAVLVDSSVRARRRRDSPCTRLVVIQHGTLGGLGTTPNANGNGALRPLPTRLSYVDELYAYNADEEAAFRRAVLADTRGHPQLCVRYFKPAITLSGERAADRPRLLFVGHPLCEDFQAMVYRVLRESLTVDAFYKPHPKAPMSAAMANVGWTIIDNPAMFPRVELLVSYPSTLVIEYEGVGIPASVHPLDIGADALPEFFKQTRRMIEMSLAASGRATGRSL